MYIQREDKLAEEGISFEEVVDMLKEEREVIRGILKYKKIKEYARQLDLIKAQHQVESKKYMKQDV